MKQLLAMLLGAFLVMSLIAVTLFWPFIRRPQKARILHRIKLRSLNPLGSSWDFAMVSAIILIFSLSALVTIIFGWFPSELAITLFESATIGALGTLVTVIPIEASVLDEMSPRLYARLSELRYVEKDIGSGVYILNVPRWARWDSNRIVVRKGDGFLYVRLPLMCLAKI